MAEIPGTQPSDRPDEPGPLYHRTESYVPSNEPSRGDEDRGLPTVGDRLGEYEILAPLGSGGMGQVYRARHRRLDREVALKVILARHLDSDAARRFEREIRAAGRTSHSNVVVATDAGEARGWTYLVMELVPGVNLARLVRRVGRLPVADACEVARQAALGLHAIDEAGLVHRDIKPANLMLTPDGTVKVLDLGLARLVGDSGESLTSEGSLAGTADYMAPEQALDLHAATIASDLYSLGCTLYCLLAGRPPFGDDRHPSVARKLFAHRDEPPPPLSAVRPGPDLPPPLLELVNRLLAKDPADRPPGAKEVAEALAPLARGHDLPGLLDRPPADSSEARLRIQPGGTPPPRSPKQTGVRRGRSRAYRLGVMILGWHHTGALIAIFVGLAAFFGVFGLYLLLPAKPTKPTEFSRFVKFPAPVDPLAVRDTIPLFNGEDFSSMHTFVWQTSPNSMPYTRDWDSDGLFTVRDGLLRFSGDLSGGLETRRAYSDYRLIVEYRLGKKGRETPDAGVLNLMPDRSEGMAWDRYQSSLVVHARGVIQQRERRGPWLKGFQVNLNPRTAGSIFLSQSLDGMKLSMTAEAEQPDRPDFREFPVFHNKPGADRRSILGGLLVRRGMGEGKDRPPGQESSPDSPVEWNRLECRCAGDQLSVFVNGVLVNQARGLNPSSGKILILSKGQEILFRKIELTPLQGP